jgi:hypothetical protein
MKPEETHRILIKRANELGYFPTGLQAREIAILAANRWARKYLHLQKGSRVAPEQSDPIELQAIRDYMENPGKDWCGEMMPPDSLKTTARAIANSAREGVGGRIICPICHRTSNSAKNLARHLIHNHRAALETSEATS